MSDRVTTPPMFESDIELYPELTPHKEAIESLYEFDPSIVHEGLKSMLSQVSVTFVCFSNRSGSNLLLDILEQLGCGCEPGDEFFNGETVANFQRDFNFQTFEEYLCFVLEIRKRPNGIFLKIGPHQLFWLANKGLINRYFSRSKFLLTKRHDKMAQAISLYIARKTGVYFSTHAPEDNEGAIEFDSKSALQSLWHVCNSDFLFEYFFAMHAIEPLEVIYENLESNMSETIAGVAQHVGFDLPPDWRERANLASARLKRQRQLANTDLMRQFRQKFSLTEK
jgi:trehalose 2-sulfotransferase